VSQKQLCSSRSLLIKRQRASLLNSAYLKMLARSYINDTMRSEGFVRAWEMSDTENRSHQ